MNTANNQRYHENDVHMTAAMLELMQQKDFEKITVKDICDKAGVNRSTFYYHFTDVYNMITQIESRLSSELIDYIDAWGKDPRNKEISLFIPYLRFLKKHRFFYRTILANQKSLPIQTTFQPLWEQLVLPQHRLTGLDNAEELAYSFIAFQGAVSAVVRRWIENGCKTSEKAIAPILQRCVPVLVNSQEAQTASIAQTETAWVPRMSQK